MPSPRETRPQGCSTRLPNSIAERYSWNVGRRIIDKIISLEEAAKLLRINPSRARVFVAEGRLPSARKIGKGWAVLQSDVRELAARERRPGPARIPFQGNWALQDLDPEFQQWLAFRSAAVVVEPVQDGYVLTFTDRQAGSSPRCVPLVAESGDQTEHWRWVLQAVGNWADTVERLRGRAVNRDWVTFPSSFARPPTDRCTLAEVDPDFRADGRRDIAITSGVRQESEDDG